MTHNRLMARRKTSPSSLRSPLTRSADPTFPTEPVATGSGLVRLEVDRDNPRCLTVFINDAPSSFIDLDNPQNVGFEYMEIMLTIMEQMPAGPLSVVHLGAAASTMARAVEHVRPNSRQIGVDIDGALLEHARQWFDLPRAPKLRLRTADAREALLSMRADSAAVIIRDVFAESVTPSHLCTREFTAQVLRVLRPGGIYLVNCADRPPLNQARSEIATLWQALTDYGTGLEGIESTGADVGLVSEPALLKGRRYGNLVLVMTKPVHKTAQAEQEAVVDLDDALLGRRLRSLAVPAQIASGHDSKTFGRNALVLEDEPAP